MMASEKGHTDIVRILLEANANVDIQNTFALVKDNMLMEMISLKFAIYSNKVSYNVIKFVYHIE